MWFLYLVGCFGGGGTEEVDREPQPEGEAPKLVLGKTTQVARPAPSSGQKGPNLEGPAEALTRDMCDQLDHGGPVPGPDCLTADVQCGDTIIGHTIGGVDRFTTRFYEQFFCTPATTDHNDGFERAYRLKMPGGDWTAEVWLDTPCADLDVAAFEYTGPEGQECPTMDSIVNRCDMWPAGWGMREKLELVNQNPTTWILVVEGKNRDEGPFALHVACHQGLH